MFDFWESELTEEQTEALLEKAANQIRRRGLNVPAILALEMHKPIAYVGANAVVAFSPFMVPFLGYDAVNDYSRLLKDRENVERLIRKLETTDETSEKPRED